MAQLLQDKGAVLLSADQLAREVVAPGTELLGELVSIFGAGILDENGALDREALGRLVFSNDAARARLNELLHPAIGALAEIRLAEMVRSGASLVVYEAPLLFEAGAEGRVDSVLLVTIDPAIQEQRLIARDRLTAPDAQRRIASQIPQADKVDRADYLIDNSGSLDNLRAQVDSLWDRLMKAPS